MLGSSCLTGVAHRRPRCAVILQRALSARFRRHHEGRPTVLQQVDGAIIADAFPQVLDMLLLGVVIEL